MEDQDTLRKAMGLSDLDSNDIIIKQKQKDCDERNPGPFREGNGGDFFLTFFHHETGQTFLYIFSSS